MATFFYLIDQKIHALVVEAHAVDQCLRRRQAKQPGFGIARLRAGRDGADFDKPEAASLPGSDAFAVLVQAGGQADRIGEIEAHNAPRRVRNRRGQQAAQGV